MYCVLRFIDYSDYIRFQKESLSTLRSVEFSDFDPENAKLYFNPNCILQLILDYISTESHITVDGDTYDLCNESGDMVNIKNYEPTINGLAIFKRREIYYIVVIKRSDSKSQIEEISPMLNPNSDLYKNLVMNIKEKNSVKKKSSLTKNKISKHSLTHSHGSVTSATNSKGKRTSSANI